MIYKDKKRNTWYFRVYQKNKQGINKQHTRSGFRTQKEAKEAENKFLYDNNKILVNGLLDINKKTMITFQELYDDYISYKKQQLKPKSFVTYVSLFQKHILPYFKNFKIDEIDHKTYLQWKTKILEKGFSYKYNSSIHICMVSILNYAITFYDLKINIASKVGNFQKYNYLPKINFWTYEEFFKFINKANDFEYYALFYTLYFTGARLGELLALNWNDYDGKYIDINKTISRGGINENYIITTPKTKSSIRKILLDNDTIKVLNELKNHYKSIIGFNENWFIFGGLKGLARTTIKTKKDKYCELANVKQIKIHEFRHSHATFLLSNGIPITVISNRLGHNNITTTLNIYSHLIPKDEDKAINLINNLKK